MEESSAETVRSFPALCRMQQEFITIRVQEPFLHNRDSWRPYISYEIFLHTNSISFTRKTSRVRRRFSEFVWLRQKMMKNASMITVPRLPPKDLFFNCWCDDEIEERRKGLQTFLNKVVEIAPLLADSLLHLFLQSALSRQEMEGCATGRTPYTVSQAVRFRCGVPGRDGDGGASGATVAIVPLKKWQVLEYGDWFVIEELEPFEFPPSHPLEMVVEEEEQEEEKKQQEKEVKEVEEEERDEAIEDDEEDDEDGTAVPIVKKRSTQKDRSASSCSSGVSVDSVSSSCSPPALPGGGEAATRRAALGLQPRGENVGGDGDGGDDDIAGNVGSDVCDVGDSGDGGDDNAGDDGEVGEVGKSDGGSGDMGNVGNSDGGDVADGGDDNAGDDGEVGEVGKSDGGNGDMGNVGNSDGSDDDDNNGGGSGNGDIGDGGDVSNVGDSGGDSGGDNDGDADGSESAESSPENRDHGESVDTSDSAVSGNAASLP